jgi:hypothetical protein
LKAEMARKAVYSRSKGGGRGSSNLVIILILLSTLIFLGIVFSVTMAPYPEESGPGTNSLISEQQPPTFLSQKILEWLPSKSSSHHAMSEDVELIPDWKQEFFSPIDVDVSYASDPEVTMCKLNFKKYSESPHLYPMFRDLETASDCRGNNRRKEKVATLLREMKAQEGTPGGRFISPTAFVFHESRVGSTLVANTLASDPFSMVYSESAPAANALLHCSTCSLEKNVDIFRQVVTLMGRTPIHKKLFFKFQSITCTKMHIALQVSEPHSRAVTFTAPRLFSALILSLFLSRLWPHHDHSHLLYCRYHARRRFPTLRGCSCTACPCRP